MNDKEKVAQQPIVIYGMANIGCDQSHATFQTLVQPSSAPASEPTGNEEVKPKIRK